MGKLRNYIQHLGVIAAAVVLAAASLMATPAAAHAEQASGLKSIFSIDAGRKYFSPEQLKSIIDRAYTNGYTDVQLILGNDGLRFFLDDMSLEVNGTSYSSDDVKAALTAGNSAYYEDPNGNALTQAEMDDIVAYAKSKGVGIVPVINSPGHMDALLVAMEQLGMKNVRYAKGNKVSARTVDITNAEAVNFLYALLQKYVTYFGAAGNSDYFNFGADEFANDVYGNPGWSKIQASGEYKHFVDYVNHVSALIKDGGMQPVCFNDGIYYNRNTSFGAFDKDLIVSYWTSGWSGFNVAKPEFLAQQGLRILNTNDAWYWVMGRIDNGGYNFTSSVANLAKRKFTDVTGASGAIDIVGSMQCVWCDEPDTAYDLDRVFQLMDGFKASYGDYLLKMADYTAVDAALAKLPADLSSYTVASAKKVTDARDAVVRGKRSDEQQTVDAYATAIEDAVAALAKVADYTAVDKALARIPADLTGYTDESVQTLTAARDAVVRGLAASEQQQVDAFAAAINKAVDGLVKKPATPDTGEQTKPGIDKPVQGETAEKPAAKPSAKPAATSNKKTTGMLPQTGDAQLVAAAAAAAIALGIMGAAVRMRRQER